MEYFKNVQLRSVILQCMVSQLGQEEEPKGSNSGPMVNMYLQRVGLKPGHAWCQALVYWSIDEACKLLNMPNPAVKTAGVLDCWNRTSASKKLVKTELIRRPELIMPGAQFILKLGAITGHTGIIERVEGLALHTIEGNSNDGGSREGYKVVRHVRHITDKALLGIINY